MVYKSQQYLLEKLADLPSDIQTAVGSVSSVDILNSIAKKFALTIDRLGELADETWLVMLGVTHPTEFIGNLEKRLGIERAKASQIAGEINEQIFLPIRESLKKIHAEKEEGSASVEKSSALTGQSRASVLIGAIENPEMTSWIGKENSGDMGSESSNTIDVRRLTSNIPVDTHENRIPIQVVDNIVQSSALNKHEPGGPIGEGILPAIPAQKNALPDNLIETQMTAPFRLPKQSTHIIEPPKLNQDPYREQPN